MDKTISFIYTGQLHTDATHLRSGNSLSTDAPIDNNGKGESFSPTDLVATALGSCILTIMGIAANRDGLDIDGASADVLKVMGSNPRRIVKLEVTIQMPAKAYSDKEKAALERAAHHCPVGNSLHPDLEEVITINWAD